MDEVAVARRHHDAAKAELEPILIAMRRNFPDGDEALVVHAYDVAQRTHAGQFRLSGDPFITHPIAVALHPCRVRTRSRDPRRRSAARHR